VASKKESVQREAMLHVPIEKVFSAFTEPLWIRAWLDLDAFVELRDEGRYELYACSSNGSDDEKREMILEARIIDVTFPTRLVLEWKGGGLELVLDTGLGGTSVNLTTMGDSVWKDALLRLNVVLESQHH
jgi:uncharacterized protein YndB with AHSA1/START domain